MSAMCLLAVLLTQPPPPPVPQPPSLPPVVAAARIEKGEIRLSITLASPTQRRVMVTRTTPDGKTTQVPTLVTEVYPVIESRVIPLAEAKATDLAGKPIAAETLAGRLKGETMVVLVSGPSLEARYRKVFRDDVVVLTLPAPKDPK